MTARYAATTILASVAVVVVIGVPTDVLPNPWFTRMTPVRPLDVVFLIVTGVLTGALIATVVLPARCGSPKAAGASGVLAWLAIGCPICNKLIVAAIGISGALNVFAPLQPLLGLLSVVIAATALGLRLRSLGLGGSAPPGAAMDSDPA
jgi:hypothetical protein